MIRVYNATETLFDNNGIKVIQPLFAEITKADNSDYYIELEDTLDNIDYYQKGLIFRVPTPWGVQGFRCDNPKVKNNRISCKAWHISYDAKNYLIRSAEAVERTCNEAINLFNDSTDTTSPFTVESDIQIIPAPQGDETQFKVSASKNSLFDMFELLISADSYGGHWVRDNLNFGIKESIGEDRGVTLAYQKNISDIEISENWDDVCTKILPYTVIRNVEYCLDDDPYVTLEENLYDIPFTKAIKFENDMDLGNYISDIEKATIQEWLRSEAVKYLQDHKLPQVNYSLSANIDNVSDIGDLIYVKHPKCNVDITTNVISVKYDAIRGKYTKIEFGNFKKEIKSLRQEIVAKVEKETNVKIKETKSVLEGALEEATAQINSVMGDSHVIYNGNEILVVDKLPKEDAQYCIRVNSNGIGFSTNGIYGTFNSAWTIEGELDMQNIEVLNLTASLIKGGTLKLGNVEGVTGNLEIYGNSNNLIASMDADGLTVYATNGDYVKMNAEVGFAGYNKNNTKIYWADGDVFHMVNAEVENEIQIAGKIKIVPVSANGSVGVGFVALT